MDALCLFDEDTLITGSSDGGVRVVSILPNQLLSFLGPHARDDSGIDDLPVERLALSGDKRLLASVAHDDCVQIWDLKQLHDDSSSSGATRAQEPLLAALAEGSARTYVCLVCGPCWPPAEASRPRSE